jgi:integrase
MGRKKYKEGRLSVKEAPSGFTITDGYGNTIFIDLDLPKKVVKLNALMKLRQRNGRWYLRLWINGRRMELATGEADYDKALLKTSEVVKRATRLAHVGTEKVPITFAELAEEYRPFAERTKSESSLRSEKCTMKKLLEYFGSRKLTQIAPYDVERYMLKRGKEVSPSTVNRSYALISHMLNKAVDWGYIKDNPCRRVKPFKEPPGRVRYLSGSERVRLLDACSGMLKDVVLTALLTGMRKGELMSLTWDDIDFERGEIILTRTKNNERRIIPVGKDLLLVLQRLHNERPHAHYVFSKPDGRPYGNWRKAFETACVQAGIKNFRFHDLRHTFASYLAMAGHSAFTIQRLMGHKTIVMAQRYTHLSQAHLRDAVDQLGAKVVQSAEGLNGQSRKASNINAPVAQADRASDF